MFIVLEVQKNLNGTGTIVNPIPTFDTLPEDDANTIRRETYLHQPQPEPEPEMSPSEE